MPGCIDWWAGVLLVVGWMKEGRKQGMGDGQADGQMTD